MGKWYEKSYRRNLVDMHIEDWNEEFLSQFDSKNYVEMLKKAKIQSAMVYINSHVGYCYWPTKTGKMHSGFKGQDKIGEVIDLCHKESIDVIVYYSLIYNNWAYEQFPKWRMTDVNGKGSREYGGRYGVCCPNNKEYRNFTLSQIREFCEHYDFEGVFFDMTFWPMVCYCDSCKERYAREIGGELPTVVNWNSPEWVKFQNKREEWMSEFAELTTSEVKKYKPGASVEHQFSTAPQSWIRGVTEGISKASDYAGGDLYGGYRQQSFVCKLYYGLTECQPFEYMTSRCYPNLSDHTTMKSTQMLKLHNYLTLAHHGAFLAIDAIDPKGTMNPKFFERLGEVFEESSHYEPYLKGDFCFDVGIYFSFKSKMNPDDNGKHVTHAGERVPHLEAALGAARVLAENHIPYGVLNNYRLGDLSKIKLLILPDVINICKEEKEAIQTFVREGGNLYMSGRTSPELAAEILGVVYQNKTEETITYIAPTKLGEAFMPGVDAEYPLTVFGYQQRVTGANSAHVMATITLPYTKPGEPGKFASIHSNPPGIKTDYPAIIQSKYGKGKVIWIAAPLEEAQQKIHREVFMNMIRMLLPDTPVFNAEGPGPSEIILFHDSKEKRFLVHVVNVQEEFPLLPVEGITIRVFMDDKIPMKVMRLPSEESIEYEVRDRHVVIHVDKLELFEMYAIDYQ